MIFFFGATKQQIQNQNTKHESKQSRVEEELKPVFHAGHKKKMVHKTDVWMLKSRWLSRAGVKKNVSFFLLKPVLKFYKPKKKKKEPEKTKKKALPKINSYFRLSALLFFLHFALIRIREWNIQRETLLNVSLSASKNESMNFLFLFFGGEKKRERLAKIEWIGKKPVLDCIRIFFCFFAPLFGAHKVYLFYNSVARPCRKDIFCAVPKTEMR